MKSVAKMAAERAFGPAYGLVRGHGGGPFISMGVRSYIKGKRQRKKEEGGVAVTYALISLYFRLCLHLFISSDLLFSGISSGYFSGTFLTQAFLTQAFLTGTGHTPVSRIDRAMTWS